MTSLTGKSAIITGASRGIGAAAARVMAAGGAKVLLAARSAGEIETVAGDIREAGGTAECITCDVTGWNEVQAMVARCRGAFGSVDILVNNAGAIEPVARLADSDPSEWVRVADVNYKGVYYGLRAALPVMLEQGAGTIINISSGAAYNALEGWSHYCSAKAAALMLTRAVHKEYGSLGIRCCGLSPGTVATDMQTVIKASGINPVSQLDPSVHIPPEWAGKAIAWLAANGADDYLGEDMHLRTDEARAKLGLPPVNA
ncbi:MAG: SDR family oxidoreductase [Anderseniella sp.]|jgi:NAD(P)-dependent dehydrogenase (short-subunit alcohol dehydrogenase family)|nr:SDR family oxidoreductase [Anderseniella sp.]